MADPKDARIAELEAQLEAANTRADAAEEALRQALEQLLLDFWDAVEAAVLPKVHPLPLTCHLAARPSV